MESVATPPATSRSWSLGEDRFVFGCTRDGPLNKTRLNIGSESRGWTDGLVRAGSGNNFERGGNGMRLEEASSCVFCFVFAFFDFVSMISFLLLCTDYTQPFLAHIFFGPFLISNVNFSHFKNGLYLERFCLVSNLPYVQK